MTAYTGQTQTTLDQLRAVLRDAQSQLVVIQPGFEPGPVVMRLTLSCSALDYCATWEPQEGSREGVGKELTISQ